LSSATGEKEEDPQQPYRSTAIEALTSTLPSVKSQKQYPLRLPPFFDIAGVSGSSIGERADHFVQKSRENPQWAYDVLIKYVNHGKQRVNIKKDLAAGTLQTVFNTIQLFYEYNDLGTVTSSVPINWKRIKRGLPKAVTKANDRSYTVEEIRKLVEHSDRRMKMIVYILCSSGIRAGALADLRLKHVKPIPDDNKTNEIVAAKLTAYPGDREQYFTFITPEAYNILRDYIKYRSDNGEKITDNSWLVRDNFKTKDVKYSAKAGLATNPKPLQGESIEKILGRELRAQNIRGTLPKGERRHEYKAAHGLRKFFTNKAHSSGMNVLHREYLLGHDIGIQGNYWKPEEHEHEILRDYLKAVLLLTISSQNTAQLQHQVVQLTIKNEEQKYVIERKLAEKEKEFEEMKAQMTILQANTSNLLKVFIGYTNELVIHAWDQDKGPMETAKAIEAQKQLKKAQ